jgi:hypothetical protein
MIEIWIDNVWITSLPVMPYIFTGGDDPQLWIPIPSVSTLLFQPQKAIVLPGFLQKQISHNITLKVAQSNAYWFLSASLFVSFGQVVRRKKKKKKKKKITHITGFFNCFSFVSRFC